MNTRKHRNLSRIFNYYQPARNRDAVGGGEGVSKWRWRDRLIFNIIGVNIYHFISTILIFFFLFYSNIQLYDLFLFVIQDSISKYNYENKSGFSSVQIIISCVFVCVSVFCGCVFLCMISDFSGDSLLLQLLHLIFMILTVLNHQLCPFCPKYCILLHCYASKQDCIKVNILILGFLHHFQFISFSLSHTSSVTTVFFTSFHYRLSSLPLFLLLALFIIHFKF